MLLKCYYILFASSYYYSKFYFTQKFGIDVLNSISI